MSHAFKISYISITKDFCRKCFMYSIRGGFLQDLSHVFQLNLEGCLIHFRLQASAGNISHFSITGEFLQETSYKFQLQKTTAGNVSLVLSTLFQLENVSFKKYIMYFNYKRLLNLGKVLCTFVFQLEKASCGKCLTHFNCITHKNKRATGESYAG